MSAKPDGPGALLAVAAAALDAARAAGANDAEACLEGYRSFTAEVLGGEVEQLKQSGTKSLGLRVLVGGAIGFATGTDLSRDGLAELAAHAVALAKLATPDESNALPSREDAGAAPDRALELFDERAAALPPERKIEMALELERLTLAHDPRIRRTDGASVSSGSGTFAIANSRGIAQAWSGTSVSAWVVALAEDAGGRQQTGVYGASKRWLADLPPIDGIAREAARRAVARIGARPIPTQKVPVIMHPDIAASWLSDLTDAFSGEEVLKKASWLTSLEGQAVGSPLVTIADDGRLVRGLGSSPYDGEGIATRRNVLIERGTLAKFLYDHVHARRAGTRSTGNAVRGSTSTPSIGTHNLYMEPGAESPEAILARVDRGFYYDDQGSYGYNPVTGDYSFQAQGFWVERGEKVHPVDGVTVAGRSLDMLKAIVAVGNDLEFRTTVASPTLLIAEMTVGGGASG